MYSRISPCKNGAASIAYCEGKGHNGNAQRNILVTPINLIPGIPYAHQMEPYWKKARKNHKVQTRRIVISFSKKELDPNNPEHIEIANDICKSFVRNYFKDRQAVIYLQADGKGKCLHAHIIVNDVSLSTPHRGCSKQQQYFYYVRKAIDKVASKYFVLDPGEKNKNKITQTERALIDNQKYSYKEDLRQRILSAVENTSNEKALFTALQKNGVEVKKLHSKKYGDYYLYNFVGAPIKNIHNKIRSWKLGYSFGPEAIKKYWTERKTIHNPTTKEEDPFFAWMSEKGESIFEFSKSGKLIRTDFVKMERLHEQYEMELKSNKKNVTPEKPSPTAANDKSSKEHCSTQILTPAVSPLTNDEDDAEEHQKELSYTRYQQVLDEIPVNYSSSKSKDFSL